MHVNTAHVIVYICNIQHVYILVSEGIHTSLASGRLQTSASENEKEREKMDYIVMYIILCIKR